MTIQRDWRFHSFSSLSKEELFTLIKLRIDVFVVEQQCAYPELDDFDTDATTLHLLGYRDGQLSAYARAMPTVSTTLADIRIGRVVVAPDSRGQGLARELMQQIMAHLEQQFPGRAHCLAAQTAVQPFYASLGFVAQSPIYLEDGIAHVDMRRTVNKVSPLVGNG